MAKWLPLILPYNNTFHFPLPFVDLSTEGRKTHQSPHGSFLLIDLFLSLLFPRVFPFAKKKSAAGVASTRSFPLQLHAYPARPHVLCSWRTAVGSIYSGDHPPPPTWTTAWKEPGDRLAHVAWEARQEKGYSPLPLPLFRRLLRARTLAFQRGPCTPGPEGWDWRGLRLVTRGRKGWLGSGSLEARIGNWKD